MRTGYQVVALQYPINTTLGDEVSLGISDIPGQFTGGLIRVLKCNVFEPFSFMIRYLVPKLPWRRLPVSKTIITVVYVPAIPVVKGTTRYILLF